MNNIDDQNYFPKVIDFFFTRKGKYLVETLLGSSLDKFIDFIRINNLSKNSIYMIGIEYLFNLKQLYKKWYLHIDLKLDNIVSLWQPIDEKKYNVKFMLIDFGLSINFKKNGELVKNENWQKKCGNRYYASINALRHNPMGAKDDLISICYILINIILKDNPPWKDNKGKNEKEKLENHIKSKYEFDIQKYVGKKYEEVIKYIIWLINWIYLMSLNTMNI